MVSQNTVDGGEFHFAPFRNLVSDDSPLNANKQWFSMVSQWCKVSSMHSRRSSFGTGFKGQPRGNRLEGSRILRNTQMNLLKSFAQAAKGRANREAGISFGAR